MRALLTILLCILSSNAIGRAFEPVFDINLEHSPKSEGSIQYIYGDSITLENEKLFVFFKGEKLELFENKIIEGNRGVKVTGITLWNTSSDIGQILIVEYADYYSAASDYGQSNALIPYRLTTRSKDAWGKPTAVKLDEISLGSSGKGFNDIGTYKIRQITRGLFELVVLDSRCDYIKNGTQCIQAVHNLDLNENKVSLSNAKKLTISPSYNCKGDITYIENQICLSLILSNLDLILSELYKSSNANDKKTSQMKWLRDRNSCESNVEIESCLFENYNSRIQYFIQNR